MQSMQSSEIKVNLAVEVLFHPLNSLYSVDATQSAGLGRQTFTSVSASSLCALSLANKQSQLVTSQTALMQIYALNFCGNSVSASGQGAHICQDQFAFWQLFLEDSRYLLGHHGSQLTD